MSSRGRMPTWSGGQEAHGTVRRYVLAALRARLRGSWAGVPRGAGLSLVDPARLGLTGKGDDAADWTPTGRRLMTNCSRRSAQCAAHPWTPAT